MCEAWRCEEKDTGLFSILFSGLMSYTDAGLIDRAEVEEYRCLASVETANGHRRCTAWEGEISSWEEVEATRCEACTSSNVSVARQCAEGVDWVCTEYELERIYNVDRWWQ